MIRVKVEPLTPFIPAGMPSHATRVACQVRPCPLEIEAESVGEPYLVEGVWQVNVFPVADQRLSGAGYYSHIEADRITVDGMKLHLVRVMETHACTKQIFATNAQEALAAAEDGCGESGNPCEYVGTQESEMWTVSCRGVDVTNDF